jgi:single-strand DNA-binding protein
MADIATITLVGRLTRNPETTETKTSSVAKFSLAVNGFKKEDVSFFDCEAWGKVGEIVQKYCEKGKQLAVAGTIRIDRWEDKEGNKRSKAVVNVRDVTLLGSKDDAKSTEPKQEKVEALSDELPF